MTRVATPRRALPASPSPTHQPRSLLVWGVRFVVAFGLLNTLLTFENRWPGFGVLYMPRLSFELCLGVAALSLWVACRGRPPGLPALSGLAAGFVLLVAVRYADVTIPAVLGRPVNIYWDGQHAMELLKVAIDALSMAQRLGILLAVVGSVALLWWGVRWALCVLAHCLAWSAPRPWLLAGVGALSTSFAAYVPDVRDTRWFFALPITPTLVEQGALLARVMLPGDEADQLGPSPAFGGALAGLHGPAGPSDVLLVFAESYGAVAFDRPDMAGSLAQARSDLAQTIAFSGRQVVSARVKAPTFGGASWLSHATLLSGVNTSDPRHHQLLLASERPTLVRHFAGHGYRTVGWMPGIKRPWPEGRFYGFDRFVDDAGMGYRGPDLGYWRIPDQAAMALLHAQELQAEPTAGTRAPRFVVFPTTTTHAPFHPVAPLEADWAGLVHGNAPALQAASAALEPSLALGNAAQNYLHSLHYQYGWWSAYLRELASRPMVMVIVGDHQPPGLVAGVGASWDVPVHIIADDPALIRRLQALGFSPGLGLPETTLGPMERLTRVLLQAFEHDPRDGAMPDPSLADSTEPPEGSEASTPDT